MRKAKIPKSLQGVLWSANVKNLDPERDKEYIIHQVLMYGTLEHVRWLFGIYNSATIRKVFVTNPRAIYTPPIFHFIKNILLGLENKHLNQKRYVKTVF